MSTQVDLSNPHREALALACYEYSQYHGLLREGQDLEHFRVLCNDLPFRCTAFDNPGIRERYIANRGFDPREVSSAPRTRWL